MFDQFIFRILNYKFLGENISGNLLEALVGAVYLDANYEMCQSVVERWLLNPSEITRIENKIVSYKSLLLEWGQKKESEDTV